MLNVNCLQAGKKRKKCQTQITTLEDIKMYRLFLGDTSRCLVCKNTYGDDEKICPYCGCKKAGAPLFEKDMPMLRMTVDCMLYTFYWVVFNDVTGRVERVFLGDSCPWPQPRTYFQVVVNNVTRKVEKVFRDGAYSQM